MARKKQAVLNGDAIEANGGVNGHTNGHVNGAPKEISVYGEKTDINRWRLLDERGRQTWHYMTTNDDAKNWPQSIVDRYFLGLPTVSISQGRVH